MEKEKKKQEDEAKGYNTYEIIIAGGLLLWLVAVATALVFFD